MKTINRTFKTLAYNIPTTRTTGPSSNKFNWDTPASGRLLDMGTMYRIPPSLIPHPSFPVHSATYIERPEDGGVARYVSFAEQEITTVASVESDFSPDWKTTTYHRTASVVFHVGGEGILPSTTYPTATKIRSGVNSDHGVLSGKDPRLNPSSRSDLPANTKVRYVVLYGPCQTMMRYYDIPNNVDFRMRCVNDSHPMGTTVGNFVFTADNAIADLDYHNAFMADIERTEPRNTDCNRDILVYESDEIVPIGGILLSRHITGAFHTLSHESAMRFRHHGVFTREDGRTDIRRAPTPHHEVRPILGVFISTDPDRLEMPEVVSGFRQELVHGGSTPTSGRISVRMSALGTFSGGYDFVGSAGSGMRVSISPRAYAISSAADDIFANGTMRAQVVIGASDGTFGIAHPDTRPRKIRYDVVNAQTYRTSDFWEETDWYNEDFDPLSPPVVTYANVSARNRAENNPTPINPFVKILDNGEGHWQWTAYLGGRWQIVAQEKGTIRVSDKFFTNVETYGWDAALQTYDFNGNKVKNRDGSFDIRILVDTLFESAVLTNLEKNELWFSMINFIHSTQDQVDWATKTSFMSLKGFNVQMRPDPVIRKDNSEDIKAYVEEVKPYHVTLRDIASSYTPPIEMANTVVTDFDKPQYFDPDLGEYRRLDWNVESDREIMRSGVWRHYLEHPENARSITPIMKLDRVWYEAGEEPSGAADRILSYYNPSGDMTPRDLTQLLDLEFGGETLLGEAFDEHPITDGDGYDDITNGPDGFAMQDARVARDTPEELVRLGAHDILHLRVDDKWGAGAPRHIVKTYDVAHLTDLSGNYPIGMISRNVLAFADGMRLNENNHYAVDYLANNIFVPLIREDGTRIETLTTHSVGYAAHTTILDQQYHIADSNGTVVIPSSQIIKDWAALYEAPTEDGGEEQIEWRYDDVWRYLNTPNDNFDYSSPLYDDSLWAQGRGGFGSRYDGGNRLVGTHFASTHTGQTIWIRKTLRIPNPALVGELQLKVFKDDYAKVFVNGVEIPTVNSSTYYAEAYVPVSAMVEGDNVIAVRVVNGIPSAIYAGIEITAPNYGSVTEYNDAVRSGEYYVEVTENGKYISSSYLPNDGGVSFNGEEGRHYVVTYYKGRDVATTSFKEIALPKLANPNGDTLAITGDSVATITTEQASRMFVDFLSNRVIVAEKSLPNTSGGNTRMGIYDIRTKVAAFAGTRAFRVLDAIEGTNTALTMDTSPIGSNSNAAPRHRAIRVTNLTNYNSIVTIGSNGIYGGTAVIEGFGSTMRIPENATVRSIRNTLTATSLFFIFHGDQIRVVNEFGDIRYSSDTSIGFNPNDSFIVKTQQASDRVTAILINPSAPVEHRFKLITVMRNEEVRIESYRFAGYDGEFPTGTEITAAAFDTKSNSLIMFGKGSIYSIVTKYSFQQGGFEWSTRSDNSSTDFDSPWGMHYSRVVIGRRVVWGSPKGLHEVSLLDGTVVNLNSTSMVQTGLSQHWDDTVGIVAYAGGTSLSRTVVSYPDAPFVGTFRLSDIFGDDAPIIRPMISSVFVEVNGLRLSPPRMFHSQNANHVFLGGEIVDPVKLRVIDDQGTSSTVFALTGEFNNAAEAIASVAGARRYLFWNDQVLLTDSDAKQRHYTIVINDTGEFNINDTTTDLTIHRLTTNDDVRVAFFRNDAIMVPRTWSFTANKEGKYRIITTNANATWLTVNGRRLVENVDYSIMSTSAGAWGANDWGSFLWEDPTEIDILVDNMLFGHDNDSVVITTFEGPPNTESRDWHHASVAPAMYHFKTTENPESGTRPFIEETHSWATEQVDLRFEGGRLSGDIAVDAQSIELDTNAMSVPEQMFSDDPVIIPEATTNNAGVVWVGNERIEYLRRTINGGKVVLDELRRATKGTPRLDHSAGDTVRVPHPMPRIPAAPRADILPVPAPTAMDVPRNAGLSTEFEGWYLKVRFYTARRGRDWNFYGYNYRFGDQQPNMQAGREFSELWNGSNIHERGTPLGEDCTLLNLCGQPLVTLDESDPVEPMEHIIADYSGPYQTAPAGTKYNPYDWTHTFWFDIAAGPQQLFFQYGAFNFTGTFDGVSYGGMGASVPFYIDYRWWNSNQWSRAYTGTAESLWPKTIDWEIFPPDPATIPDGDTPRDDMRIPRDDGSDKFYNR